MEEVDEAAFVRRAADKFGWRFGETADGKGFIKSPWSNEFQSSGYTISDSLCDPELQKDGIVECGPDWAIPGVSMSLDGDVSHKSLYPLVRAELDHAYAKHGRKPWGRHEFYAILKEEVDELWSDVKADAPQEQLLKEVVQVAAMCFRYFETGDKYRGEHPTIEPRKTK